MLSRNFRLSEKKTIIQSFISPFATPVYSPLHTHTQTPSAPSLGHVVLGTLSSLGHLPVDILVRGLDVARLAVDAAIFLFFVCQQKKKNERGHTTRWEREMSGKKQEKRSEGGRKRKKLTFAR